MLCYSSFVCEMDHLCDAQPLTFSLSNSNDGGFRFGPMPILIYKLIIMVNAKE